MKAIKFLIPVLFVSLFSSCKKDGTTPQQASTNYSVRMTDAPGNYDAVNIDLRGVEITGNNSTAVMLNTNAHMYDLLRFSNGYDTLIATGAINFTTVEQIRLILGPNNTVVVDGVKYPLSTPSAEQSGLKLQVHQALQPGVAYSVLLDFDANKSIVQTGNGQYKLKPVIRTIETAISGSIRGKVMPAGTFAMATATSASTLETYSSPVNANGEFVIMGLHSGTYSLVITPVLPMAPVTVNNITVTAGVSTDVGTLNF